MAIDRMMPMALYRAAVEGKDDDEEDCFEALRQAYNNGVTTTAYGGNTVLHVAALHGQKQFMEKILLAAETQEDYHRMSSMLLARNKNGETVLHCAAEKGHADIVSLLISATKKLYYKDVEIGVGVREMIGMMDNVRDTALHKAVRMGHLEVAKLLIQEDPEFEYFANDAGETPIYIAAELQFDECLVEMLNTCKKPSYDGPLGRNALHAAVLSGFEGTEHPFLPTIRTVIEFMSYYSFLFIHRWDIKVHTTKCTTPLLERKLYLCEKIDDFGWTPLHYAVRVSNAKAVAMILERKRCAAYIRAGDDKEWTTIFHIAARNGDVEMMERILKRCPDGWEMKNSKGQNVLHEAVLIHEHHHRGRVIKHIERCNQFDNLAHQKDEDGNTPLHLIDISHSPTLQRILSKRPKQSYIFFNKKHQTLLDMVRPATPYVFTKMTQIWSRRKVARRVGLTANPEQNYKEEKEIEIFVETSKTIIVVATLILTMTFAAGFTVPGGYESNPGKTQGMPILLLLRNKAFLAFIIPDIYAFMCSICAIIIHSVMVEEASSSKRYTTILWLYRFQRGFLIHACLGAVIAFLCGMYVTLAPLRPLAIAVLVLGFAIFFPTIRRINRLKGETGLLG